MKMKKMLFALLSCGALLLTGCATPNDGGDEDSATCATNGSSAQTSCVNQGGSFAGANEGCQKDALSKRTYYFNFDRSDIRDCDMPAILANASYLAAHCDKKVIVEGHTDPRGSREYNVALGERRANAVAEVLKAHGVRCNQIRVVSYGAERLASPGHAECDYQLDRRAVIAYQN